MNSVQKVTIGAAANLSGAIDVRDSVVAALVMPAAWDAAAITFAVSDRLDGTYVPLYDDFGTEVSVTVSTSRQVALDTNKFLGVRFLKVRSGTAASAVNQGAAADILVIGV